MKALKIIPLTLLLFVFLSCHKESETFVSVDTNITILNAQGQNLLDDPKLYAESNINIYHLVNGVEQLVNQPLLDHSKGFAIIKDEKGKSTLRVYLNNNRKEKTSITLIKFGDSPADKIEAEFSYKGSSIVLEKVWFNGEPKDVNFIIVK